MRNPIQISRLTNGRLLYALIVLFIVGIAWQGRFVTDDAFISFRYAKNLANGLGLVWNQGEAVEGYSNFLWTLLHAIPFRLSIDPVFYSYGLGILCLIGTLEAARRLSSYLTEKDWVSNVSVALLAVPTTFTAFATSGLETQLQAALLTSALAVAIKPSDSTAQSAWKAAAGFSVLSGLAILTRLDSVAFLFVPGLYLLWKQARQPGEQRAANLMALLLPVTVIVGAWLVWKIGYYGTLLPNTYYAKVGGISDLFPKGLAYLWTFAKSYLLWLAIPWIGWRLFALKGYVSEPLRVVTLTVLVWAAYVAKVGGDFMEFRFMVVLFPAAAAICGWVIAREHRLVFRLLTPAFLIIGALHHNLTFPPSRSFVESVKTLGYHIDGPRHDWAGIGKQLNVLFKDARNPISIALTPAGAIPFYSELPALDMLGLTDPVIARNGLLSTTESATPGHYRHASGPYMVSRGITLVLNGADITHPRTAESVPTLHDFAVYQLQPEMLSERSSIIEIPLDRQRVVYALYLTPNPDLERIVIQNRLRVFPVRL